MESQFKALILNKLRWTHILFAFALFLYVFTLIGSIRSGAIEELINIIGLGREIPLTNEKIVSTVEKYKQQFQDNDSLSEAETQHFIDFFDKIREKLLISKKEETIRDLYDEEIKAGGMTRKADVFQNRDARQATLLENNVIGDERIVGLEAANPAPFDFVALDTKNPLLRNTVKQNFILLKKFL